MKIYLSGPITGKADLNRPAFDQAAAAIVSAGHTAVVPHAIVSESDSWAAHMKADLHGMLECDAVFMLAGWEGSKGAKVERSVAFVCGMQVLYQRSPKQEGGTP